MTKDKIDSSSASHAKTMTRMPESEGKTVCYKVSDIVTAADYEAFMRDALQRVNEFGAINLLFYYDSSFKGWEPEAADANMKSILESGHSTTRLAYVNPPEKKILVHKIAPELFGGETKYFSEEDLASAVEWVKAG